VRVVAGRLRAAVGACGGEIDNRERHALIDSVTFLQLVREAELQWRAVALERGVGPVSLILRFPEVALEIEPDGSAVRQTDLELVE